MRESLAYDKDLINGTLNKYIKHKPDSSLAKGIATIQLFDTTGKLVREVQSENIITDQVALCLYQGFCSYAFFGESLGQSYKNRPFAYILLTDYAGEENSNDIVRGYPIGFSSTFDSQSSANLMGGNYNKAESKLTYIKSQSPFSYTTGSKYHWHIVIDFPTQAANGTFQTIYAQQVNGVNQGETWGFYPLKKFKDTLGADLSWFDKSQVGKCWTYNDGYTVLITKCTDDGNSRCKQFTIYVLDMNKGKYTVYDVDSSWYTDKSLMEDIYNPSNTQFTHIQFDGINQILYMGSTASVRKNFNTERELLKFDLQKQTLTKMSFIEDLKKFHGELVYGTPNFYVRDGFLYSMWYLYDYDNQTTKITFANFVALKHDSNGTLVKSGNYEVEVDGDETLMKGAYSGYYCFFADFMMSASYFKNSGDCIAFDYDLNFLGQYHQGNLDALPLISSEGCCFYNEDLKGFMTLSQGLDISDKGELWCANVSLPRRPTSHNKLPSPVTKTSAHTMKLQYDISFEKINPSVHMPDWAKE